MTRRLWRRPARGVTRDPAIDPDVREEIAWHLAASVDERVARGESPTEAARTAARRFGSVADAEAAATRVRRRSSSFWRSAPHDIRQAVLGIRRSPWTSLCAAGVAAIGLTTTFASLRIADALLMHPPPGIARPAELFSALESFDGTHGSMTASGSFDAMRDAAPDAQAFAWEQRDVQVSFGGSIRPWVGAVTSGGFFTALGVRPAYGRLLTDDDDRAGRAVVVVSLRFARAQASRPEDLIGRPLTVNGRVFDVVGVAGGDFRGIEAWYPSDLWLPLSSEPGISAPTVFPDGHRVQGFLGTTIGWLRIGVRVPSVGAVEPLRARLTAALLSSTPGPKGADKRQVVMDNSLWLPPFSGERQRVEAVITPVLWAIGLTLMLTSACLASLCVGRLSDRTRELSVRVALGASRHRIVRLVLFEIAGVVALGAIIAALASAALLDAAGALQIATGVHVSDAASAPFNIRALGLLIGLAGIIAVLASIGPFVLAVRVANTRRVDASSTRVTGAGNRFRRGLIAVQIASGCALLTGAALLTRSIDALRAQSLGYEAEQVAFSTFDPAGSGMTPADLPHLELRVAAMRMPPASLVAWTDSVPHVHFPTLFVIGEDAATAKQFPVDTSRVSDRYFDVLGVHPIEGRVFDRRDIQRPVVIISAPLAATYWPGRSAVGRTILVGGTGGVRHEIVGVVPGLRDGNLRGSPGNHLYLPFSDQAEALIIVARSADGRTGPLTSAVATAMHDIDPRLVPLQSGRLIDLAARTIEQRVLIRFVTMVIGAGSLVMVAVGVWGLSRSNLRRRWREFGIRQALGATRGDVARLALGDARFVTLTGGALGIAGGWQLGGILKSWLFGVQPHDPLALALGALVVVTAAFAGAAGPARQAGRIDPAALLRED